MSEGPPRVERIHPPAAVMRWVNPIVRALVRRGVRGVSDRVVLLAFTGRRTGIRYEIPVGLHEVDGGTLSITDSGWRANLRGGPDVELIHRGVRRRVAVDLVEAPEAVASVYARLIEELGVGAARQLGLRIDGQGAPTADELVALVRRHGLAVIRYVDGPRPPGCEDEP